MVIPSGLFCYIYVMTIEQIHRHFLESSEACTDTRKITKNCLFFALKGEHFDGNKFALEALEKGAKYAIVDDASFLLDERVIMVDDVLNALQKLAIFHRKYLNIPIIALTGSNGKTTPKELINAVLSTSFKTTATKGNLNNHIGVPLTLLSMNKTTELGIVEMGANHQKEIELLCNIALPDYGLITNFGKAHLEGFGSLEGVIKGKSELYDHLKQHNKTAFINADDFKQVKQIGAYEKIVTFGSRPSASIKIELVSETNPVSVLFKGKRILSQLTGIYNYNNIAVAVAVGAYFGVDDEKIKNGIEGYVPSNNRSQLIERDGKAILLDAYNANPTSMMAALQNAISQRASHKMLILGDMFELGDTAAMEHQAIVDFLTSANIDRVYLVGTNFYKTEISTSHIEKFESFDSFKNHFETTENMADFILIKGSRGMALERVLDFI